MSSPLDGRVIATIGSGVMAEGMIAGLLRGRLVDAEHLVASHPRADRRDALASAHGIRTVASNVEAVRGADIVLLAIKPQMLGRVGREIRPALQSGQLVISILAGATTTALIGFLGHRAVVRAMPNTPDHLGFPRHVAHDLVVETLEGSTLFAKQSGLHPAELRNMVTSPGGTSAAALHELESGRLRTVLSEAVWAAFRRTVELGEQLEAGIPAEE
jgi:pyrroline-5-carboxylate reductase